MSSCPSRALTSNSLSSPSQPRDFPRNILSDTDKLPQLYTLDYGNPDYGMVLMTYTWEDQSNDISAFDNSMKLFQNVKRQAAKIIQSSETRHKNWADKLVPVSDEDIWMIHWQNQTHYNGAFVLGRPGNDPMTAAMFLDFLNLSKNSHPPLLMNGDSIGFSGGWIDGGLQCAMNTVSAVLKKHGKLSTANSADSLAPVNAIGLFQETTPYTYY
jgi:tryptophan 2-monooxygenase